MANLSGKWGVLFTAGLILAALPQAFAQTTCNSERDYSVTLSRAFEMNSTTTLEFKVQDIVEKRPILLPELIVSHKRRAHLIVFSSRYKSINTGDYFSHVHPEDAKTSLQDIPKRIITSLPASLLPLSHTMQFNFDILVNSGVGNDCPAASVVRNFKYSDNPMSASVPLLDRPQVLPPVSNPTMDIRALRLPQRGNLIAALPLDDLIVQPGSGAVGKFRITVPALVANKVIQGPSDIVPTVGVSFTIFAHVARIEVSDVTTRIYGVKNLRELLGTASHVAALHPLTGTVLHAHGLPASENEVPASDVLLAQKFMSGGVRGNGAQSILRRRSPHTGEMDGMKMLRPGQTFGPWVMVPITFPKPGMWRIVLQFTDGKNLLVPSFWINVV